MQRLALVFSALLAGGLLWATVAGGDAHSATYKGSKLCLACHKGLNKDLGEAYPKTGHANAFWKVGEETEGEKIVADFAKETGAAKLFDAGDVQANGFQIVEDDRPGRTFTETGASYMGFAASALLATGLASQPFYGLAITGDGSFTMNPQILIDGVQHGARGCILLLDNRRMAAISSLQAAQYGAEFATSDQVEVDYVDWARAVRGVLAIDGGRSPESLRKALDQAHAFEGLSLVHVPVYYGPDPLGGLGAFGRWNVGNWVRDVQALRHKIGL